VTIKTVIRYACPLCKQEIREEIDQRDTCRFFQGLVACKRCCSTPPKTKESRSQGYTRKERVNIERGGRFPVKFQEMMKNHK
jgi:hypothetical protein